MVKLEVLSIGENTTSMVFFVPHGWYNILKRECLRQVFEEIGKKQVKFQNFDRVISKLIAFKQLIYNRTMHNLHAIFAKIPGICREYSGNLLQSYNILRKLMIDRLGKFNMH